MSPYSLISDERDRQEQLHADGTLPWICSQPDCPDVLRLSALMEEVGEVGSALLGDGDLRTELVQVAAVAVAWLEGIE